MKSVLILFTLLCVTCEVQVVELEGLEKQVSDVWEEYSEAIGLGCLIGFGVTFLLFGHRLFKLTLFVAGFLTLAVVVFVLLRKHSEVDFKMVLLISLVAGLAGGITALCLVRIGIFIVGALLGFWLATLLFSISLKVGDKRYSLMEVLDKPWQYYGALALACLIGGALTFINRIQKYIIILATSIGGSFCINCFIDHWAKTGFSFAIRKILLSVVEEKGPDGVLQVQINNSEIGLVLLCISLSIIGVWYQLQSSILLCCKPKNKDNNTTKGNTGQDTTAA